MPTALAAMTPAVPTIHADATIEAAISLLLKHQISGATVVDDEGYPVGMITEYALLQVVDQPEIQGQRVAVHMTTTVLTADENDPLDEVAARLRAYQIQRLPVVRAGKVVGAISRSDLLRYAHRTGGAELRNTTGERELPLTVVLVDDDPSLLRMLEKLVRSALGDIEVVPFGDADSATAWLTTNNCEVLITDVELPDGNGLELLRYVKQRDPWVQVFVVTGHSSVAVVADAMRAGATDFLRKPLNHGDVTQQIRRAAQTYQRWTYVMQSAATAS